VAITSRLSVLIGEQIHNIAAIVEKTIQCHYKYKNINFKTLREYQIWQN